MSTAGKVSVKSTDEFLKIYNKIVLIFLAILFSTQMLITTQLHGIPVFGSIISGVSSVTLSISEILLILKSVIGFTSARKWGGSLIRPLIPALLLIAAVLTTLIGSVEREEEGILIAITVLGLMDGIEFRKILMTVFGCGIAIVFATFLLCMFGLIDNNRGTGFGFIYRTDYACHLLMLLLIFCFYYGGNITWKSGLGIAALILYTIVFVRGKTSGICMILVVFATVLNGFMVRKTSNATKDSSSEKSFPVSVNRVLLRVMEFAFPICAVATIGITLILSLNRSAAFSVISKSGTIGSRIHMSIVGFENFPITLFGKSISQQGFGGQNGYMPFYYFLDCSYIRLLLQNGIVIFVLFLGIMTYLSVRLYRKGMFYELFLLAVVALDCALEHHIIDISYNIFIVLALSELTIGQDKDIEPILFRGRAKPLIKGIALLLAATVFLCGCFTAFKISNYSSWEPNTDVTLVLPGNAADGFESDELIRERVSVAADYMRKHEGAVCLLCASQEENEMMSRELSQFGFDSGRIFRMDLTRGNISACIETADNLILENSLPSRRAYCLFSMEQYVASELSHNKGIPFNAITIKTPPLLYLPLFFVQQCRVAELFSGAYE